MPDTFLTADPHWGHRNIIKYCGRPFADLDEMHAAMKFQWNAKVRPEDRVYILGDLAMGQIRESLQHMRDLNGDKILINGNHDRGFSGRKKRTKGDRQMYADVGVQVLDDEQVPLVIDATHFGLMCHFPYVGDSHNEDRYRDFRPIDRGGWLFHGHVHERWAENGRMINVGVDVRNFAPMHTDEIVAIMDVPAAEHPRVQ